MDKKVIALIIVGVLLVVGCGIGGYVLLNQGNHQEDVNSPVNNNNQNNEPEVEEPTVDEETNEEEEEVEVLEENLILTVYFSQSGNTETVANFIHEEVGGRLVELETVQTYPSSYNELLDFAQNEKRNNARPELKTVIENISQYDTIFIGYPNWWADMPMPIYTFLESYDFTGITIVPFVTSGGSGFSGTPAKIRNITSTTVLDGLAVSGSSASSSKNNVVSWLNGLGY